MTRVVASEGWCVRRSAQYAVGGMGARRAPRGRWSKGGPSSHDYWVVLLLPTTTHDYDVRRALRCS